MRRIIFVLLSLCILLCTGCAQKKTMEVPPEQANGVTAQAEDPAESNAIQRYFEANNKRTNGGNIDHVQTSVERLAESTALHDEDDVYDAIETVMDFFHGYMTGCTLKEVTYLQKLNQADGSAAQNRDIVLLTVFDVDEKGGDGSFSPNEHVEFTWYLAQNNAGEWVIQNYGAG